MQWKLSAFWNATSKKKCPYSYDTSSNSSLNHYKYYPSYEYSPPCFLKTQYKCKRKLAFLIRGQTSTMYCMRVLWKACGKCHQKLTSFGCERILTCKNLCTSSQKTYIMKSYALISSFFFFTKIRLWISFTNELFALWLKETHDASIREIWTSISIWTMLWS